LRICCRLVVDLLYNKQMDSRSLGQHSINYMHSSVSLLKTRSHAVARIADRTASQQTIY